MISKKRLYIGLIVVGLVLLGSGLWLLFNPILQMDAPEIDVPKIDFPESTPIIAMDTSHHMSGWASQLLIYGEGTIIYRVDTGLRMSPVITTTWSTGKLNEGELTNLFEFINDSGFEALNSHYDFPGIPAPTKNSPNAWRTGEMECTIAVDSADLQKVVSAARYISPDDGMTYPDMPYPLNEVYRRLKDISENQTEEIYTESKSR